MLAAVMTVTVLILVTYLRLTLTVGGYGTGGRGVGPGGLVPGGVGTGSHGFGGVPAGMKIEEKKTCMKLLALFAFRSCCQNSYSVPASQHSETGMNASKVGNRVNYTCNK